MKNSSRMTECFDCKHKRIIPGDAHIRCNKPDETMTGNPHGVINGWFMYPINFDPTWKQKACANYEILMSSHSFDLNIEVYFDFQQADPDTGFPETVTIEEICIPGFSDEENREIMVALTSSMEQALEEQAYEWMRNQSEPDEDMPRKYHGRWYR